MNYSDLISATAVRAGTTKAEAQHLIGEMLELVIETLQSGDSVSLSGLGKLKVSVRPQRAGVNPRTGEKIVIDERRVIKFSPSKDVKRL